LTSTEEQEFLISLRVSAEGFTSEWPHCSQVANYLATFASSKQKDPKRFTVALSGVLNQLLETICDYLERQGEVTVTISNLGHLTGIKLEFPVDEKHQFIYLSLARELEKNDAQALYEREIARVGKTTSGPVLGLLQVVIQQQATFEAQIVPERNFMRLFMKMNLET
jgi:hypothetical protein